MKILRFLQNPLQTPIVPPGVIGRTLRKTDLRAPLLGTGPARAVELSLNNERLEPGKFFNLSP